MIDGRVDQKSFAHLHMKQVGQEEIMKRLDCCR